MAESGLEELIKSEKKLFRIISFCEKAAVSLGEAYDMHERPYSTEIKWALGDFHGFDLNLHLGMYGAYGEWNKLSINYKGNKVLDVEYDGPQYIDGNKGCYEYGRLSCDADRTWSNRLLSLSRQKGLIEKDKKSRALAKKRYEEQLLRQKELEEKTIEKKIKAEKIAKSLGEFR